VDNALGIAVVIATFAGPIAAVFITRKIDRHRAQLERRMEVFRSLMGSRRTPLSMERVKALNMVEIEFYGIKSVAEAYQETMKHINAPQPLPNGWHDQHQKHFTRLLTEIAKVLGYKLQQLDVLEGGYYPQGFVDIEMEQQAIRRAAIEILSGKRPLLVSPAAPAPPSPFPPPPPPPETSKSLGTN